MTSPGDQYKRYQALYHDFTEAYVNVHLLRREFHAQSKKLVETIGPEFNRYAEKVIEKQSYKGNTSVYQQLVNYMGLFDDFTQTANRLFSDMQITLERSDAYMNRLLEFKLNLSGEISDEAQALMVELMPELTGLVTGLNELSDRAAELDTKMQKLEGNWEKIRQTIT